MPGGERPGPSETVAAAGNREPARRDHRPGRRGQGLAPRPGRMFAALAVPNFRLYLTGQAVSLTGTWMQVVAQSWLVLQLTGSGTLLGLVAAAQFLPVLLWLVFVLAGALGAVNSVDQPGRQTFVPEMVGRHGVQNAVSLNSVLTNASRASALRSRGCSSPPSASVCACWP